MSGSSSSTPRKAKNSSGRRRKLILLSDSDEEESAPLPDSSPSSTVTPQSQTQPPKDASTVSLPLKKRMGNFQPLQQQPPSLTTMPQERQSHSAYPHAGSQPDASRIEQGSNFPRFSGLPQKPSIMNQTANRNVGSSNVNIWETQETLNQRPSFMSQDDPTENRGMVQASSILDQTASGKQKDVLEPIKNLKDEANDDSDA